MDTGIRAVACISTRRPLAVLEAAIIAVRGGAAFMHAQPGAVVVLPAGDCIAICIAVAATTHR